MSARARILEAPPPAWRALLAEDPDAGPSHRPELWRALAEATGEWDCRFAVVEVDGTPAGGAPLALQRRGGMRWLHALPFMLSGAPLARPGLRDAVDTAVADSLAELVEELGLAGGTWSFCRPSIPEAAAGPLERLPGETLGLETTLVDLDADLDALLKRADKSVRIQCRTARAEGLAFAEEPRAIEAVLALQRRQARRWTHRHAPPVEFLRRLLDPSRDGTDPPLGRLFTVRDRGRLIAGAFVLDHPREALAWWSGTREDAREAHASTFLLVSLMGWAREAGRARLNLGSSPQLPGAAAFKQSLGGRVVRYPVRWLAPARGARVGRAVAAVQRMVRRGRFRGEPG